jgi:hypothetical protein
MTEPHAFFVRLPRYKSMFATVHSCDGHDVQARTRARRNSPSIQVPSRLGYNIDSGNIKNSQAALHDDLGRKPT